MPNPIINRRVVLSGAAPYNPMATAWYLASYGITLNGGNVASQLDKSGNGYTASQGTATSQPAFTSSGINSLNSITYTAAASPNGDFLLSNALGALFTGTDAPWSWTGIVYRSALTGANQEILRLHNTGNTIPLQALSFNNTGNVTSSRRDDASTLVTVTGTTVYSTATVYVMSVVFSGTTISIWINGVNEINASSQNVGATTINGLSIGSGFSAGAALNHFNGQLPEMMFYNSAISTALRQANENYLRLKYNAY